MEQGNKSTDHLIFGAVHGIRYLGANSSLFFDANLHICSLRLFAFIQEHANGTEDIQTAQFL